MIGIKLGDCGGFCHIWLQGPFTQGLCDSLCGQEIAVGKALIETETGNAYKVTACPDCSRVAAEIAKNAEGWMINLQTKGRVMEETAKEMVLSLAGVPAKIEVLEKQALNILNQLVEVEKALTDTAPPSDPSGEEREFGDSIMGNCYKNINRVEGQLSEVSAICGRLLSRCK